MGESLNFSPQANSLHDTICAPATPHGRGALSIIRVSGPQTQEVLRQIFQARTKNKAITSWQAIYGHIMHKGKVYDEVIVVFFASPNSYTAEDMAEIYCHGNPIIVRQIITLLNDLNIRVAAPGEFTERAFWNGRIDLTQAEAVHSLIYAQSEKEFELWLQNTSGLFRETIEKLRQNLINLLADIEAEIDFTEFDESPANSGSQDSQWHAADLVLRQVQSLIERSRLGQNIQNGFRVAITGRPNVGKSSLLNTILNQDRAIVSAVPGTTRDVITENIEIKGFPFRFFDTAGIRKLNKKNQWTDLEMLGIDKSKQTLVQSDILLVLFDACEGFLPQDQELLDILPAQPKIFVINKIDQLDKPDVEYWRQKMGAPYPLVFVSAHEGLGMDELETLLVNAAGLAEMAEDTLVLQQRVRDLLVQIQKELIEFQGLLQQGGYSAPPEILAVPLRQSIEHMGAITGRIHNEEILGSIFSRFCIGK